jgi:lactoylglutathione lyase
VSPTPSHVGLCTPDLAASVTFFVDGLGFEAADGWDLDAATLPALPTALEVEPDADGKLELRSQMVRSGSFAVELLAYGTPQPTGTPSTSRATTGLTHLALWVDDLDAAIQQAVAAGGTALDATRADLGVELVFLADPVGVRVELMSRPT